VGMVGSAAGWAYPLEKSGSIFMDISIRLSYSAAALIYFAVLPGQVSDVASVSNPLGIEALRPVMGVMDVIMTVSFLVIVLCSVASLVARFRRSRGEQRQQMKWLTYAAGAMFAVLLIVVQLPDKWTWYWIVDSLTSLVFGAIPVAVGIAILKYRLYDIDRIINRTLVYAPLTAALALVYAGSVVVMQRLFVLLIGERATLAVVASTLAIAALFNPLRRRVQGFVDRRFYRSKYDARKTLDVYSTKLRDETDLDALNSELVSVVRETVQPAHASLWLRPDTAPKGEKFAEGSRG
jgi:hypothetical protein